ncbi:ATP-binding protein [Rhizobium puerariae]|uniref:histidine kinase n=1 Tax=Rhizobium puerariae TaxID=1585791 RepID=A0ABV6ARE3_9HYPH
MTYPTIRELFASRRSWAACIGLIVALSACLGWLVWRIQTTDRSASDFRSRFENIRALDGRWDREILSIQLGIAPNYDAVTQAARDMKMRLAALKEMVETHASLAGLQPAIEGYANAVNDKAWLSEQVKASYAMLRNSVSVLPNAISDSYRDADVLQILPGINKRAADLITETITGMVSFTISPTPLLRDAIQGRIATTRAAMQQMPADLARTVERFLVQIEVVVEERQRGNQLMLQVTEVPTAAAADRIQAQLVALENSDAGAEERLWNFALLVSALIVLSFAAFVFALRSRFAQLDNDNRMLIQANQDVEEQLMQSAKLSALGQMVAGITHEINTPLAYVKAVFELIKERVLSEFDNKQADEESRGTHDELEVLLNDGLHGLEEMATLVRTMKNFSRLDKGHIESFSVEEGIESALLIARPQLKYVADVKREFDGVPSIMGSPSQLRQVILNLIVNAVDAMSTLDRRGTLTLRTRLTSSDTVQIDVADNGPGIPEDVLARIFDPFFTTKPVGEGTGMGLPICYRIIENHGGTITVNSKPGRGTVFTITLPRQDEKSPALPRQINPPAAA